jgi:hypothetical protein
MAIDPNDIQLTPAQQQFIADLAEKQGRLPQEVLEELVSPLGVHPRNGRRSASAESAHDIGQRLGLFAALENGPPDLSTNPQYMEGFGQRADRTGTR